MGLRKLAKDKDSGMNGCPTVYVSETDPAKLVIQGDEADSQTLASLENPLKGETAVEIKREVVEEALRILREQEGST